MGLAKFDDQVVTFSPPRTKPGIVLPSGLGISSEVQVLSSTEGNFPFGR